MLWPKVAAASSPVSSGKQGVDEVLVLAEKLHQPVGDRIQRQRLAAVGDDLVHHVPQADTPGVVLHPARLKGGVLAAVGKDDELLVALGGGVDHRLGQECERRPP